jgi:hypothetical protein
MSSELIRKLQNLYEGGQYLQIMLMLYKCDFDEIPKHINIPIVTEAITHTFHTSSNQEELFQATVVLARFKNKGYLHQDSLNNVFDAFSEAFLKAKGDKTFFLEGALLTLRDESWSENLRKLYTQAKTREAKVVLASWIGSSYKEQGLLILVDNLYTQNIISNDSIRAILKNHSLLEEINLKSGECDAIISALLDYLEIPGPVIDTPQDEKKYDLENRNRTSAARILVFLNQYPKTSYKSKTRIQGKGDLIVTYHCADRMHDAFVQIPLSRYLSGNIK